MSDKTAMMAKCAALIQHEVLDPVVREVEEDLARATTAEEKAAGKACLEIFSRLTAVLTRIAHKESK